MSAASTLPMRVAVQNRHRKQAGHRFRIEMRAGDGTSRNTLCGPAFPLIDNLPANPSAVSHALTPLDSGLLARALSTTNLARLGPFLQPRWILNLFGTLSARSSSFLRVAFVNDCRQPANRIAHILSLTPVWLPSCAAHIEQHATKEIPNVGKAVREFGNV